MAAVRSHGSLGGNTKGKFDTETEPAIFPPTEESLCPKCLAASWGGEEMEMEAIATN
jgi:hypothetical protein